MSFPLTVPEQEPLRVNTHQPGAERLLAARLALLLQGETIACPVVLCIGTDRSTGDALGPLVGSLLSEQRIAAEVWGTLEHPVHAANLALTLERLHARGSRPIIAVDACLGAREQVGSIVVGKGRIRPGAGVNKILPEVGDIHITGTVNVAGYMEHIVLQNTRLWLVVKMAQVMAAALALVFPSAETAPRADSPLSSPLPGFLEGSSPPPL